MGVPPMSDCIKKGNFGLSPYLPISLSPYLPIPLSPYLPIPLSPHTPLSSHTSPSLES
ncbi:hypothetical protein [Moorena sp. SIO4G3]|uniref:hypothetical protein n=1 Tax=Moorena sp. SIO4G3 TaxID=2607821 RepID=UPI00142C5EF6|nr:hypothetical protein [Moorena sp. SIO4G3]NEO76502.1 hypothetical protein [Moorena sp. SIO4G3]